MGNDEIITFCSSQFSQIVRESRMKLVFILVVCFHISDGKLRFASYYGDHMVLQKSPESAVLWGYGPEGVVITVYLSGPTQQQRSAEAAKDGIWRVSLDPVEAGGPYSVTATCESSTATLTDVLFGDIWLCGGQSNMAFQTSRIFNSLEELNLVAKYPDVRPFMVARDWSGTELTDIHYIRVKLPWSVPSSEVVAKFSAVCWLFGRYLHDTLKYPIGLIDSCWGGTPVEAWSSSRALQQCGLDYNDEFRRPYPSNKNSVLWNAMIHPLVKMTIKGAIWYQGESNANYHQDKYNCSFPAMIDDWRMAFHRGSGGNTAADFPFGFVQLSTYIKYSTDDSFPNIRWHQTADFGFAPNLRMQKTFMAVAMDLPDETSKGDAIHPREKKAVAYRLTLGARAVAYNETDVLFQGPFPSQILSTATYINITYDQTLSVSPSTDTFQVCCSQIQAPCGPGSVWVAAPVGRWNPDSVQLSISNLCSSAEEVMAIRYAWKDWPCSFKACPVYSASGILPAPPFIINRYAAPTTWKHSRLIL
ncbi:sialate O-acetylesterase [Takifugu rubripes]|nr:sialate O-acetylesterase [Takifugu rubripes]